ncbi:MAG TPA: Z1 domain-containing protein, partial [Frankiaceae bacterium]|nr:Z1 domain-containing protein [Frankiaceae bacterium]
AAAGSVDDLPQAITDERRRLVSLGAPDVDDAALLDSIRLVLREATFWLVNSVSALNRVDWTVAPIHILVGGNKLDRGYTVEGLTVTYMNRPPSIQVDTLEQRARAFGYRRDQLPYCQFFATRRTVRALRDIVFTEYDLRAQLRDHVEAGGSIATWAREIGLLLPAGMKPTRDAVVRALSTQLSGWYSVHQPSLDAGARSDNERLVAATGLFDAPYVDYGRLPFRTTVMPFEAAVDGLLSSWRVDGYSPGWRHEDILHALRRHPTQGPVDVLLMEDDGGPRTRKWDDETGFVNLFQGKDVRQVAGRPFYPGDRAVPHLDTDPDKVAIQIHRVVRRDRNDGFELLAPAVYLGSRPIVRKV